MKYQKTLPSIAIKDKTNELIDSAMRKYNQDRRHLAKLSQQEFRRIAYELLAQIILSGKEIPVELS